jgi:uncharacterized protein YggT (Ycf19 family)
MFFLDTFLSIAYYLIYSYTLCIVISGVLSLVGANPSNPIVGFLNAITNPPCRFLTRHFPRLLVRNNAGYIDLSPVVLILFLGCLMIVIEKIRIYYM